MITSLAMVPRDGHRRALERLLSRAPVVALLGARQVGKTTLAREIARRRKGPTHVFDLESSADVARLADPLLTLSPLRGLVVIDEVQRRPDLFPSLRVLADRPRRPARFLVLGSASPDLLRQSAETLAGRIAHYELPGFTLSEVTPRDTGRLWLRGGFPSSYTARGHADSYRWRGDFIRTFLERDVPQLGIAISSAVLERFWSMLAHYHAQVWNGSELGRALGVSHHAVRRYLDALESTYMLRNLKPWSANLKKRQVKSPKIYIRDSGLLHHFLGLTTHAELERHPQDRRVLGGLHPREPDSGPRPGTTTVPLLGHAFRAGDRPGRATRLPAARLRDQAHELAHLDPFDAFGDGRPRIESTRRDPRRRSQLSAGKERARHRGNANPRRSLNTLTFYM